MTRRPAFIDLEASGLHHESYPIEVGWSYVNSAATALVTESHLIRPVAHWLKPGAWKLTSSRIHKISREELRKNGESPAVILTRMNKALAGRTVYAGAPSYDGFWLNKLVEASGTSAKFRLSQTRALSFILDAAIARGISNSEFGKCLEIARQLAPHTHRAGPDAAHLAKLWKLVSFDASR